jgi:hypothetical protein
MYVVPYKGALITEVISDQVAILGDQLSFIQISIDLTGLNRVLSATDP